jgi:hypothetical protein
VCDENWLADAQLPSGKATGSRDLDEEQNRSEPLSGIGGIELGSSIEAADGRRGCRDAWAHSIGKGERYQNSTSQRLVRASAARGPRVALSNRDRERERDVEEREDCGCGNGDGVGDG